MTEQQKILNELDEISATADLLKDKAARLKRRLAGPVSTGSSNSSGLSVDQVNKLYLRRRKTMKKSA